MDIDYNTSKNKVKYLSKFKLKKYRDKEGLFLIEGEHLVSEALKHNIVKEIIKEVTLDITDYNNIPVTYLTKEMLSKISNNKSTPSIMALCSKLKEGTIGNKVILLDNVQDPANVGAVIRSAVAFNFATVILGVGCADLYNPKVVSASQGMIFNINILSRGLKEIIPKLKNNEYQIIGTKMPSHPLNKFKIKEKIALIIGNEGSGVSSDILELCDELIYIPINNVCESLNVSVAAGIIMYEMGDKHE